MSDIETLINNIVDQDFSKAAPTFNDIMGAKITDALDAEKVKVASSMMGQELSDDELENEDDFEIDDDDEDLDVEDEDFDEDE